MYQRHGWQFIDEFVLQHHFQRFTSNKYQHPQPFHFFFWVLPLMTIPWLPFFVAALWKLIRGRFKWTAGSEPGEISQLILFAASWTAVPVFFFSMSGSKLPGYVLPALPGALILAAIFAWEVSRRRSVLRKVVPITAAAMFVLLIVVLITTVPKFANADSVKSLLAAADSAGTKPVLMFHTVSHNAEFYAAGRIDRDESGAQKKILSLNELVDSIRNSGGSATVLMPIPYLEQIKAEKRVTHKYIGDNGEVAAVDVSVSNK
jgi:4-amino-4-deoxy-L-arabinose transferase-like glycosyltransferase